MAFGRGPGAVRWFVLWLVTAGGGGLPMAAMAQVRYSVFPGHTESHSLTGQPTRQTRVSLTVRDSTIKYVIKALVQQAHLQVVSNADDPTFSKRVSVHIVDVNILDALALVLRGTGLMAKLTPTGEAIMIVRAGRGTNQPVQLQTGRVVGHVTDSASGKGVSGATVTIVGTKLSTLTAESGEFMLRDVPVGKQVVTVKLFGYKPSSRSVTVVDSARVAVRIVLTPAASILSGVVTTATGTQKRREVGNDIVTLNVDSIMQTAPITSVTDLLESRVPGLTVLHSSGVPGNPARLRLRGPSSITGSNDPIVVIDGVRVYAAQSDLRTANLASSTVASTAALAGMAPGNYAAPSPIDQLDPNSIETIEVLKGPSASSLYGSDAANGVIIITTKHGRAGPTHWSTTVGQGLSSLPGEYPAQTVRWGHSEFPGFEGTVSRPCLITDLGCNVFDSVTTFQVLDIPRWSPFAHGTNTKGSVTVSGGVSTLTYSLTGSAETTLGYLRLPEALAEAFQQYHGYAAPGWAKRPDRYTTWGGSGQLTAMPAPGVRLTFQSQLFHGLQQQSSLERMLPALLSAGDTTNGVWYNNVGIAYVNAYERSTDEQLTFNNVLQASWAPWDWLPLTGTAGLNINTGHDVTLLPRDIVFYPVDGNEADGSDTVGHYAVAQKSEMTKSLTLNTTMQGWHGRLRTALGFDLHTQSSTDLLTAQDTLALGVNTPYILSQPSAQSTSGTSTFGWFFEPRLIVSNRFFLTPGFRLDGGNANGRNASVSGLPAKLTFAALFPKVNFSWVAVDRQGDDAPVLGVLTLLRPRLALGSAGVQPNPGDQFRLLRQAGGDTLGIDALGNTQLRPERSSELEVGFDAELWHGRVTTRVTRARKMRHDAIIQVPVAASIYGGKDIALNIGLIRNTSTELEVSMRPIETAAMSWSVGGSLSHNNDIVLKLDQTGLALVNGANGGAPNVDSYEVENTKVAVGYPLFGRWAKPILGYSDANQDGIIESNEIRVGDTAVYLGRQDPAYTAALNTDVTLFQGRLGIHANFLRQGGYAQLNSAGGLGTFLSVANSPNATFGQQASYVAANDYNSDGHNTYIGLVQTVSEWQFQSFSVNFVVPTSIAQRFRSRRMNVALQGSNLGLWTNYRGKDPNVNAFPNGNAAADYGQLPEPRTWQLIITLGN